MYIGQLSKKIDEQFQVASDSKLGGDPVWICEKKPTNFNWNCPLCKNKLTFLFQLATSYEEYMRVIYIFCCLNNTKCNINRSSWLCIKGKKKVLDFSGHNETAYTTSNNYFEIGNNKKEPLFGTLTELVEKSDLNNANVFGHNMYEAGKVTLETLNNNKEKSINWNQLFSENKTTENEDISLFGTFAKSVNDITTKISAERETKCIPSHYLCNGITDWNAVISNQAEHNKYNTFDSKEKEEEGEENDKKQKLEKNQLTSFPNTNDKMVYEHMENESQNDMLYKFPCYYIYMIEDDEEFCNDYLYERAKQLHKHYEQNKEELENFEESVSCDVGNRSGKKKELDIEDEEEKFENDFNGCVKFHSYLKKNFNQILRYWYNGKFLYMYKYTKNYLMNKQMKCNNCGNKLVFEFQFFSTIVYKLEQLMVGKPSKEKSFLKNMLNNFNVGNVFIFTCASDCVTVDGTYSYEHVELEIF